MITLGEKLKKLRKSKGLTLDALANKFSKHYNSGTSKSLISIWENNKQVPSFASLEMYCDYFKVSLDYLQGSIEKYTYAPEDLLEEDKKRMTELQKEVMNSFINSNSLMYFNGGSNENNSDEIKKSLEFAFINILKLKKEL